MNNQDYQNGPSDDEWDVSGVEDELLIPEGTYRAIIDGEPRPAKRKKRELQKIFTFVVEVDGRDLKHDEFICIKDPDSPRRNFLWKMLIPALGWGKASELTSVTGADFDQKEVEITIRHREWQGQTQAQICKFAPA